ncbi:MAG TPA: protease pro-enzyme activation domain-containing protein [Streptosporangiaceae bacterium]|jgi:hypothetical protein
MRIGLGTALAVATASALVASTSAGTPARAAASPGHGSRAVIASTVPVSGPGPLRALAADSPVRLSVFTGRDTAGLAAAATAVSGATTAQQRAVRGWLSRSGLAVTHDDGFVVSAVGTVARAGAALQAGLLLSHPTGSVEQIVPSRAMTVPATVAGAITTIRVSLAVVPFSPRRAAISQPNCETLTGRPGPGSPESGPAWRFSARPATRRR